MFTSALFSIVLLQSDANALSCMEGVYDTNISSQNQMLPANTQTVVWSASVDPTTDPTYLVDVETGEDLQVTSTLLQSWAFSFIPEQGFHSGSSYQIVTRWSDTEEQVHAAFTIGDEVDDTPPEVPVVLDVERTIEDDSWGETILLQITLEQRTEENLYYQVEVADNEAFSNSSTALVSGYDNVLHVGVDPCMATIPDDAVRSAKFVRVRAIDAAGNQSDVSAEFAFSSAGGVSSCSSAQVDMYAWMGLLGMTMLGFRRRKTPRS